MKKKLEAIDEILQRNTQNTIDGIGERRGTFMENAEATLEIERDS